MSMLSSSPLACPASGKPLRWWSRLAAFGDSVGLSRCRRVLYLLAAIWLLNAFDLALTLRAHADGMLFEHNPIARVLLPKGPAAVFLFKVALVSMASCVMYTFRHRICTEVATVFVFLAYIGVACQWQMCYHMYDITLTSRINNDDLGVNSILSAIVLPIM